MKDCILIPSFGHFLRPFERALLEAPCGLTHLVGTFWCGGWCPNLAQGPQRAAWTSALCEQCQMSGFTLLLLLQIMDKQGKTNGEIEPTFLESSCWKHSATSVMDRVSISGLWESRLSLWWPDNKASLPWVLKPFQRAVMPTKMGWL